MKFGFIGLGKMGSGLAKNLARAGYDVWLYDISEEAVERVQSVGGFKAGSTSEIAQKADVIFTSLPLPVHLQSLLMEEAGLISQMKPGSILIDVSTIDPKTAREIANEAEKHEVGFLACPLGKGPAQAEEGTEPIFVGGKEELFNECKVFLEKIGNPVSYIGDVEQSTAFKLISNMVGMANLAVMSEGIQLAVEAKIDPNQFKALMHDTGGDSAQLHLRGPMILANDYTPKFSVDLAAKDVRLGVEMAEAMDLTVPFSTQALQRLQETQKLGYGDMDAAALHHSTVKSPIPAAK